MFLFCQTSFLFNEKCTAISWFNENHEVMNDSIKDHVLQYKMPCFTT